ncbi:MAG: quinone-dependent dihydroorotate dehydrogenase [Chloroflexota bacterium]
MTYKHLIWPVLSNLDAETVHEQTLSALQLAQLTLPGRIMLRQIAGRVPKKPVNLFGLTFPNVVGMAAGFDKDVRVAEGLAELGFGHIEVGTLTPKPQEGNPHPRIFRLKADEALINRMGFPNGGVEKAVPKLKRIAHKKRSYVLGVSLGKQKETPLAEAADDYLAVMRQVYVHSDYLAVNISSPNTPGLRELQGGNYLGNLLKALRQETAVLAKAHNIIKRPLLVKIAPDLTYPELDEILTAVLDEKLDGIIATNTTLDRDGLRSKHRGEAGGLSGLPLTQKSTEIIDYIYRETNGRLPIIGVGGIRTANHIKEKLDAGASLVQLYTGLVYEGPGLVGKMLRNLR